jgi:4-hydroxyphenylacetate 3-monooxygenase
MSLMTGAAYKESLRDQRRVWIDGERVDDVTRHAAFRGMIDAVAQIYDLQHDPRHAELLTFDLGGGQRGSRFYQPPRSQDDLAMRRRMTLTVLDQVSPVLDRFGDETVTPLFVMSDRRALLDRYDVRYGANVERWLAHLQATNLFMTSGNTDMKGDRSKSPHQQDDPDVYLRVVKERDDGIVIRGAKFETGAAYAHVAFVKPTVGNWIEANRDFAVACIVPLNAPGIRHICRAPLVREADAFERPLSSRFDEIDTLIVFDDVLVPWENVIFSRAPELASLIRADLTRWSGHAFLVRSFVKADLFVGAALLVSEHSRAIAIPQVRDKIVQLMAFRETLNAFLLAAEAAGERTETGLFMPNQAIQNAGRMYAATTYHQMVQALRDVAGGTVMVLPDRRSLSNPEIAGDIEKYFGIGEIGAEARIRALNLVGELTGSGYGGRAQAYQMFAESPIFAQATALYATYDRSASLQRAARLAGLDTP